mmetsp:Transcript_28445/g.47788  ORF Transcript_28445/g.47788 Transcript_28445/m.47788 type:complete len:200 (-) Transcript_28445:425-1024(-)
MNPQREGERGSHCTYFINGSLIKLLLDGEVLGLDLGVDAALGLGAAVLVDQVLEAAGALTAVGEPHLVLHLLGGVHVPQRGKAHVVQRVVGHVVLPQIAPAVLEGPERQRIQLLSFPHRQGCSLGTVVATTTVDPAITVLFCQRTIHRLDFAEHIVLVDVLHPVVAAVLRVVVFLVFAALGGIHFRLEAIVLLNLPKIR